MPIANTVLFCTIVRLTNQKEVRMDEARQKFEALIMAKGKGRPEWDGYKYDNLNIQTYWRWFYLGYTVKGEQ